ncbi:threonine synthase [Candidatus Peregrinibacteria bacterium]|nr:threonine synthase [Candidatus Peregrinibacteria bacterium]
MPKNTIHSKQRYLIMCVRCGKTVDERHDQTLCGACGGPLDLAWNYANLKDWMPDSTIEGAVMRYAALLPIQKFDTNLTLQEGDTPLYKLESLGKKLGLRNLYVKNEGANPTGVFKDRGTYVEVLKAKELREKALIVASSGNMAASCAAYTAKAQMPCYVLVPETTPVGKLVQMLEYGAHVVKITGEYSDCVRLAQKLAPLHNLYLAGDFVFRREGQKTLAYELCDEFQRMEKFSGKKIDAPDVVIVPMGAGTHLAGIWKGFKDYFQLGFITKMPRMIGVQADGSAVIVEAFDKNLTRCGTWKKTSTICSAVAVADPLDGDFALQAVYQTGGTMLSISDTETLKAQKLLAEVEALFVEPSSALTIAALPHLFARKLIKNGERIVCVATGNGLKDPQTPLMSLPQPPILAANEDVVSRYLQRKIG